MTVKFTNNASTTVATGINTTATSLVVTSAAGFPTLSGSGDYCYLTIQQAAGTVREVVKATALSSNTFTIVRAQDGTSAGSWSVSDVVELRVTAALLTDIVDAATHDSSVLSVDSTNNRVGVNDTTPSVTLDISGTDAIALPVGTTAQRPSAGAGRFRYNSSLSQFEGYTDAWGAIGGGGTNTFTTDSFTGNGSLVAFNLSQTVSSENNLLAFIDGVFQTQDAYAIATASGTTTLTFSAAPANGRKIVVYSVAAGISGSNLNIDSMTGDGSDVTLTLSIAPVNVNNTIVTIDGVYQSKSNYSISGTTLTFSTAPPTGTAVEVMTFTQTEINVPVDGTITSAKLSGALTTPAALTVTGALTVDTNTLVVDAANNRVGIGTSSPASLIDATGAPQATSGSIVRVRNTSATSSNTSFGGVLFTSSPGTDFSIGKSNVNAATSLSFRNGNTGASLMELTSAGNVGVATISPAADYGTDTVLEIKGSSSPGLVINDTGQASKYGIHADSNDLKITFGASPLAVFQNDGKVGIGASSPSAKVTIQTASNEEDALLIKQSDGTEVGALRINNGSFLLKGKNASQPVQIQSHDGNEDIEIDPDGFIKFETAGSERMRIDSGGHAIFTIGTNAVGTFQDNIGEVGTGNFCLQVSNSAQNALKPLGFRAEDIRFATGSSERARLDSSGNFLVGKTSTTLSAAGHTFGNDGYLYHTRSGDIMWLNRLGGHGTLVTFMSGTSTVGTISTNANSLPSDRNFKTNINALTLGLDFVASLKPVTYNYKIDEAGDPAMAGLIAQDVEQSLNEAGVAKNSMTMLQHKPLDDEKQSDYQMDYLKLVPVLINAIKEQQATIESQATAITDLTTRLTALENN